MDIGCLGHVKPFVFFCLLLIPTHIQLGIENRYCPIRWSFPIPLGGCRIYAKPSKNCPRWQAFTYCISYNWEQNEKIVDNLHMSMNHFYNWERNEMWLHSLIYTCPWIISPVTLPYSIPFNEKNLPLGGDTCCRAFHVPPELEFPLRCASVEHIPSQPALLKMIFLFPKVRYVGSLEGITWKDIYDTGSLIEMFFVDRMFLWLLAKMRTWFCYGKKRWKTTTFSVSVPPTCSMWNIHVLSIPPTFTFASSLMIGESCRIVLRELLPRVSMEVSN